MAIPNIATLPAGYQVGYGADSSLGTDYLMDPNYGSVSNMVGNTTMQTTPVVPVTAQKQQPRSWFSNLFGSGQNQNTMAYNPNWGISKEAYDAMNPLDKQKFVIGQGKVDDMNAFDWEGAFGTGIAGLNFLMDLGMYGPRKDYLESSAKALNQNIDLAREQWDEKKNVRQGYGSAFSNN